MCRQQFPKTCAKCHLTYPTFADYVRSTHPTGAPIPDTIEDKDPIGLMSLANCRCGSTLSLLCEDLAGELHQAFNEALAAEAATAARTPGSVLVELRDCLRQAALEERPGERRRT